MYSIGEFSHINRITPKTLRHYDRIGLLKPARVDGWTGYRFYSPDQLREIRRILRLRDLGCSLAEIAEVVDGRADERTLLRDRERALVRAVREDRRRLARLRAWLADTDEESQMADTVSIRELPTVTVASMRTTVPNYDAFFEVVPRMGEYMTSVGAVCRTPEYCFTIFHNDEYRDEDIDVEICEAVEASRPDSDTVTFKVIDGVPEAACVMHHGAYDSIGESYNALFSWIEANGYRASGHPRESYIDGIWNCERPEDWRTEVQVPVTKR